jgi:hypothetical protein
MDKNSKRLYRLGRKNNNEARHFTFIYKYHIIIWRFNMKTDDENINMENIFLNEVEKGEKPYKLTDVYDQVDLMFLKSLFQSEQIPYKMEFEHGSALYAGSPTIETAVYVLEKDKADANKILEEYNKSTTPP